MANEAVIIELLGHNLGCPIQYTIADNDTGTNTAKGTLMELTGDRTVTANTTDNAPVVGIAAAEKVGGDGSTTISVWTNGIFDMLTAAGTYNLGDMMANSATENTIQIADASDLTQGSNIGYILEATTVGATVDAVRVLK